MMNTTHNDNPVTQCGLDRTEWRNSIVRQIIHADPPKVIGIHGTWGAGKTSLMAQMYTDLGGDHIYKPEGGKSKDFKTEYGLESADIQPIWFEAWQYQHEPNILAALLKEIRDQLSLPYKIWNRVSEDTLVAVTSALQSISMNFKLFGAEFGVDSPIGHIKENLKAMQQERLSEPMDTLIRKKLLQEAIDQLLSLDLIVRKRKPKPGRKAVIFIDDLDRCVPDTAFRILESIKVYLNLDNCVFVLGMDLEGVERILARYYEKQLNEDAGHRSELKNLSRLYLEKICQDVYHLPLPAKSQKMDYFCSLLKGRMDKTESITPTLGKIAQEFDILPPFPRSIKILANVIISHCSRNHISDFLLGEANQEVNQKAFLIISYLYAFHYEVYQLCMLYPEFYNEVFVDFCENPFDFQPPKEGKTTTKGIHRVLDTLTVRIDRNSPTEKIAGNNWESRTDSILHNVYPDRNFRQVLWIRQLVQDVKALTPTMLEQLKM